jgi:hypothetical protein
VQHVTLACIISYCTCTHYGNICATCHTGVYHIILYMFSPYVCNMSHGRAVYMCRVVIYVCRVVTCHTGVLYICVGLARTVYEISTHGIFSVMYQGYAVFFLFVPYTWNMEYMDLLDIDLWGTLW